MDSPLIGMLLFLVLPALMASVATDRLAPEDFLNPGGWKFPKAEVIGIGVTIGGMTLGLFCLRVLVG